MAVVAVAIVMGTASGAFAAAISETIVIRVDNQCRLPEAVVKAARDVAADIYAAIGVRLVWTSLEGAAATVPAGARRLTARLTSREEKIVEGTSLSRHVLGVAPTSTSLVYVFCRRVTDLARTARIVDVAVPLGRAMAHEIGHHLLPGLGHSESGIMRARLDILPEQSPGFTELEADSIRARLMASR
jgi:hypothetical protein